MATFTDEMKAELVEKYLAAEPTPDTSTEIVKELADEYDHSANGIRMFLIQSGKYVAKTPGKAAASAGATTGDKPARVSKEGAQQALTDAITAAGGDADAEIISKLTGKAAQYFTGVITGITK